MRATPEKKQERERVRMQLMRATLTLAASHGFSGLGLREVSREADIAPTSFYRHFTDIEELGLAIVEQLVHEAFAAIVAAAHEARARGSDALREVVHGLLAATMADPELMRFVIAQRSGVHPKFRLKLRVELAELVAVLKQSLPTWAPASAPEAAMLMLLDGVGELLDAEGEAREARQGALLVQLLHTTRALLGLDPSAEEGA